MPFKDGKHGGGPKPSQSTRLAPNTNRTLAIKRDVRQKLEAEARRMMLEHATITLTRDLIDQVVGLIHTGNYPGVIAESLGVPGGTFTNWVVTGRDLWNTQDSPETHFTSKGDPEGLKVLLYLCISRAEAEWEVDLVERMAAKIERGSTWQGEMTMLQRRKPDRWDARGRDINTGGNTLEEQLAQLERDRQKA
jgi:hypothetical protein